MFEQSVAEGPGLGTVTDHSLEILVLLLGAFAFGWLLSWLFASRHQRQLKLVATELARTRERLAAAERRPLPTARLRESNSTEHERTLNQLRESREAETRARERILELEGRVALLEHEQAAAAGQAPADPYAPVLPFVNEDGKPRKK